MSSRYSVSYDPELCRQYGVAVAVLVGNVNYFLAVNKADGNDCYYHSMKAIAEAVGMSYDTIKRAAKKAKEVGLIDYRQGYKPGTHEKTTYWSIFALSEECNLPPSEECNLPPSIYKYKRNNIKDNLTNTNVLVKGDNVAREPVNESNSQKLTQKAEPDSKPSYGNSTINSMFDYWRQCVGTPIISREKSNRRACYNLLRNKHIGEKKLRHAIEFVGEIKEDRFAPRISDFVDLQSKFNELCAFKTKYQAQQDVSGDKTQNKAVSSAMKGYNSAGGNVEFVPWRPTAGDLEREREWQEKERRQTEESAKVDPEWLEKLKEETIRKIYDHGDRK